MRVKSSVVREAIQISAALEFVEKGFLKATIGNIARCAGTAHSNVYVYFQSKLEMTLAIYEPWLKAQNLVGQKLRILLEGLWKEIPSHQNGMTTTLIQAQI